MKSKLPMVAVAIAVVLGILLITRAASANTNKKKGSNLNPGREGPANDGVIGGFAGAVGSGLMNAGKALGLPEAGGYVDYSHVTCFRFISISGKKYWCENNHVTDKELYLKWQRGELNSDDYTSAVCRKNGLVPRRDLPAGANPTERTDSGRLVYKSCPSGTVSGGGWKPW